MRSWSLRKESDGTKRDSLTGSLGLTEMLFIAELDFFLSYASENRTTKNIAAELIVQIHSSSQNRVPGNSLKMREHREFNSSP